MASSMDHTPDEAGNITLDFSDMMWIKEENEEPRNVEEETETPNSSDLPRNAPLRAVTATKQTRITRSLKNGGKKEENKYPPKQTRITRSVKSAGQKRKKKSVSKNSNDVTAPKRTTRSVTNAAGGQLITQGGAPRNRDDFTAPKRKRKTKSLKNAEEKGKHKSESTKFNREKYERERPWKCYDCPSRFINRFCLNRHASASRHHQHFRCGYCEADTFTVKEEFDSHTYTHDKGPQLFQCNICECWFSSEPTYKHHRFTHADTKDFRCWQCGQHFDVSAALSEHMLTHKDQKTYECHICTHRFTNLNSMKRHVLDHASEKQHSCEYCKYGFLWRKDLQNHMKISHQSVEQYKCPSCGEMKRGRSHVKECEEFRAKNPHPCLDCPKRFPTPIGLHRHRKREHDKTVYRIIDVKMEDVLGYNLYNDN